ncbi:MAG: type II toxin-antitoxin system RelE/ParE family toxin [Pseudomonadota bacterium]
MNHKKVQIYKTHNGRAPFIDWLEGLDKVSKIRVLKRVSRLEIGNLGDYKVIEAGLYELRFFFGSGYRVYFGMLGDCVVVLLCGGDKSHQADDIKKAMTYWKEAQNEII